MHSHKQIHAGLCLPLPQGEGRGEGNTISVPGELPKFPYVHEFEGRKRSSGPL